VSEGRDKEYTQKFGGKTSCKTCGIG
jgi:hypothetical protein